MYYVIPDTKPDPKLHTPDRFEMSLIVQNGVKVFAVGAELTNNQVLLDGSHAELVRQHVVLNGVAINSAPGIRLESGSEKLTVRAMDLITPIGMGQRGLIDDGSGYI